MRSGVQFKETKERIIVEYERRFLVRHHRLFFFFVCCLEDTTTTLPGSRSMQSIRKCFTVYAFWQAMHLGGSSFFRRNEWVMLMWAYSNSWLLHKENKFIYTQEQKNLSCHTCTFYAVKLKIKKERNSSDFIIWVQNALQSSGNCLCYILTLNWAVNQEMHLCK